MIIKIRSFEELVGLHNPNAIVTTMYSGGLDSSYVLLKLRKMGFKNILAVVVDLGEEIGEAEVQARAEQLGAKYVYIDAKTKFAEDGIRQAIKANAKYCGLFPVSSSISRPVIANAVADYATSMNSSILLHTANRSQNSLRRLNGAIETNGYRGAFGSPYECSAMTREHKLSELKEAGIEFSGERSLSGDENLWCREFESGSVDDPESFVVPEEAFVWTSQQEGLQPIEVTLKFEGGELVQVDNRNVELAEAIQHLNETIGRYGHGRYIGLEHLADDEKVLEVREAPAAMLLMEALRHIEMATLDTAALQHKLQLEEQWTQEAVAGRWNSSISKMCMAGIEEACATSTGILKFQVDANRFFLSSLQAENPKYIRDRDQWEIASAQRTRYEASVLLQTNIQQTPQAVA